MTRVTSDRETLANARLWLAFASMLFVVLGGLLALGVRYQLAWPNQNVPYAALTPTVENSAGPKMTQQAPEANLALWHIGDTVEFKNDAELNGRTILTICGFLAAMILALYLLLPRLAGLEDTWNRIEDGSPGWIVGQQPSNCWTRWPGRHGHRPGTSAATCSCRSSRARPRRRAGCCCSTPAARPRCSPAAGRR